MIGRHLVALFAERGHEVAGMIRTQQKAGRQRDAGAEPVVCDVCEPPLIHRRL